MVYGNMSKLCWNECPAGFYVLLASNVSDRRASIRDREQLFYWAKEQSHRKELDLATSMPWLQLSIQATLSIQAIALYLLTVITSTQ
jgi:hypothetical protein